GGIAEKYIASRGPQESSRRLEAGRLPRAVGAEERHGLAFADLERQRVHGGVRAVALREAAERDHGRPLRRRPEASVSVPRPRAASGTARPATPRRPARTGGLGTSGNAGGRASGLSSSTGTACSTGNVPSAAPSARAAKPAAIRSAAARLPRRWSNTVERR